MSFRRLPALTLTLSPVEREPEPPFFGMKRILASFADRTAFGARALGKSGDAQHYPTLKKFSLSSGERAGVRASVFSNYKKYYDQRNARH